MSLNNSFTLPPNSDLLAEPLNTTTTAQALNLHHYVKSNSPETLNELTSDPLGSWFSMVSSLLTGHQKGAGQPAAKLDEATNIELSVKNR